MAASSQDAKKENASWNVRETKELVQYLWEHRAESGDGGTFKPATYNAAADHIRPHLTAGARKEVKHVKRKWDAVSACHLLIDHG